MVRKFIFTKMKPVFNLGNQCLYLIPVLPIYTFYENVFLNDYGYGLHAMITFLFVIKTFLCFDYLSEKKSCY